MDGGRRKGEGGRKELQRQDLPISLNPTLSGAADITHRDYKALYQTAVKGKKAWYVESLLAEESEIDGPFNNSTLVELCRTREWTPGLIFKCEAPEGGIGNVRNVFLNCVRYAIEAGGLSPLVPPSAYPF